MENNSLYDHNSTELYDGVCECGQPVYCALSNCDDRYYATIYGMDLCIDHFDQIR